MFRGGTKNGWGCLPCMTEYQRVWREKNREKLRRYEANRKPRPNLRPRVVERLGSRCASCGTDDIRVLQVDHVHGGGEEDRRSRTAVTIWRAILRGDEDGNFQLLCANCHLIKTLTCVSSAK